MKRTLAIVLLVVVAAGGAYGLAVTEREASYRRFVEQGDAALARDDSFAAIEAFSVAISLKADSMAPYLKRGEAYRRRGEYEAALRDVRKAADLDRLAIHPRELLGDVHYRVALADGASAHMRFGLAVQSYREAVTLDDRAPRLQYKLGLAAYRAGQTALAIDALRQAIRLEPRFAEAHYVLGLCLRAGRRQDEAVRALERAVALSPALLAAREELSGLYGGVRRHDASLGHLEALAALQPSAARERSLAVGYARAGHADRAVSQLARAARRYPDDRETYVTLGRLWLERAESGDQVDLGKAIEALQSAAGGESGSKAMTLLGRALLAVGDAARAEQMLEQATLRFPVDPAAFRYLAEAAQRRGHMPAAHRALVDYAALTPHDGFDAPLLARLAEAYLQLGDPERARRAVDAALRKDPASGRALDVRARLR